MASMSRFAPSVSDKEKICVLYYYLTLYSVRSHDRFPGTRLALGHMIGYIYIIHMYVSLLFFNIICN